MIDTTDLDARVIEHRTRVQRVNRSGWTRADPIGPRDHHRFRARAMLLIRHLADSGRLSYQAIGDRLDWSRALRWLKRAPS